MALDVAGIELLASQGCDQRPGWKGCEVPQVIDGCAQVIVTITQGIGCIRAGVEAESALAHLQLNGAEGQRGLDAVVDFDANVGGVAQIGGDDGGEGEVGGGDGWGTGGWIGGAGDASYLAGDELLWLIGLGGVGLGCEGDVAQEVRFVGGVQGELDALDGNVSGDIELRDGGGCGLGDGTGGGDDGVEGLGLAAGGDGGAVDDGGVEMGEGAAVEGAQAESDVELREGGLLQGEGGGAGEIFFGEVEEGEGAEGFGGGVGVGGAGDLGDGEEVLGGELEVDLGVGTVGHVEVEEEIAVAQREVADGGGLRVGGLRLAVADDEGDFLRLCVRGGAEEAEVVGGGAGGGGVDARVEDGAGNAGCAGRQREGANVAQVLGVGERGGSVADGGKVCGLEKERGCDEDGRLQVAASLRRLLADGCGRTCFPMA